MTMQKRKRGNKMFICRDCGCISEEIPWHSEGRPYGEGYANEDCVDSCHCGGYYEPAKLCPVCGVTYIREEDESICSNCYEDGMTYENALKMGEDAKQEIEINGFWTSVFKTHEIEEILKKTFDELPPKFQKRYIQEFCEEDEYYYRDFLEREAQNVNIH